MVKVTQGHSHFKVKVILESNGNVFQFLSQSGWLAFVQMLIFLVIYILFDLSDFIVK